MIKYMITAIIIAISVNAGATDKWPKAKSSGYNYKKRYKQSKKHRRQVRRNPNCRHTLHL